MVCERISLGDNQEDRSRLLWIEQEWLIRYFCVETAVFAPTALVLSASTGYGNEPNYEEQPAWDMRLIVVIDGHLQTVLP